MGHNLIIRKINWYTIYLDNNVLKIKCRLSRKMYYYLWKSDLVSVKTSYQPVFIKSMKILYPEKIYKLKRYHKDIYERAFDRTSNILVVSKKLSLIYKMYSTFRRRGITIGVHNCHRVFIETALYYNYVYNKCTKYFLCYFNGTPAPNQMFNICTKKRPFKMGY